MADHSGETFRDFEHKGWQGAAGSYHDAWTPLTGQAIEPLLEAVGTGDGARLLDVGCGPGYLTAAAARRGAQAIGMDFSEVMLEKARALHPHLDFVAGDADDAPFPDGSFDGVIIAFGLLHFASPERALAEAHRLLTPGGRLAFTVWASPNEALGFRLALRPIEEYGSPLVQLPAGPPFFRFSQDDECRRALQEAGFVEPAVTRIPQVWRLHSPDDVYEAYYHGTARTGALLRAQPDGNNAAIRVAMSKAVSAFEHEGTIEIPMPAVLATASKSK